MSSRQWNSADRALFTVATVLLLLFSYFLYDDSLLFSRNESSTFEKVGQVFSVENDVRQKNKDSFSWNPARKQQDIRHMDSIFTGENSQANIRLNDGTIIRVKPNSLVTINMKQGQMQLDLKYGDILGEVAADSKVQIRVNGEDVALKGTAGSAIQIKKTRAGEVKLDTVKGKAFVETSKGQKEEVKTVTPPVVEIQNLNLSKFAIQGTFDLPWKVVQGEPAQFQVSIAKDGNFNKPLVQKTTGLTHSAISGAFPSGSYQWKVAALKEDGSVWSETPPHQLNISVVDTPQWVTPEKDGTLSYRMQEKENQPAKQSIKLAWTKVPTLDNYEIQIAQDEKFENIIEKQNLATIQWETPPVQSGDYFFRVRAMKDEKTTDWSPTRHMAMNISTYKLKAPILTKNKIEFTPPAASERRPASEQSPQMGWQQVEGADKYVIQLSPTTDFTNKLEKELPLETFNWEKYKPGRFYFRVFARDNAGGASPPSEVGRLFVSLNVPVIEPIKPIIISEINPNAKPEPKTANIKWSEVATAPQYELEMDTDPEFSSPHKIVSRNPASDVQVPAPGKYHLRVRALNEKGRSISSYSPMEDLLYTFKRQLSIPALLGPIQDVTLYIQKLATPFVRFDWKAVPEAQGYEFQMSKQAEFTEVLYRAESKKPRLSVRKKLPDGKVYWRVRARSADENFHSDWTPPRQIQVEKSDKQLFIE